MLIRISGLYTWLYRDVYLLYLLEMPARPITIRIAYTSVFTGIGIILAHMFFFPFLGTLAFPGQHLVNAVAGVILGPWWASLIAILVGTYRNFVGIGTLFAYPGGIPGAIVVGLVYRLLRRRFNPKVAILAALFEPVGTVLIGGTISLLIIAPAIGHKAAGLIPQLGIIGALTQFYIGWAASSIPGAVIGYLVLIALTQFQAIKD